MIFPFNKSVLTPAVFGKVVFILNSCAFTTSKTEVASLGSAPTANSSTSLKPSLSSSVSVTSEILSPSKSAGSPAPLAKN